MQHVFFRQRRCVQHFLHQQPSRGRHQRWIKRSSSKSSQGLQSRQTQSSWARPFDQRWSGFIRSVNPETGRHHDTTINQLPRPHNNQNEHSDIPAKTLVPSSSSWLPHQSPPSWARPKPEDSFDQPMPSTFSFWPTPWHNNQSINTTTQQSNWALPFARACNAKAASKTRAAITFTQQQLVLQHARASMHMLSQQHVHALSAVNKYNYNNSNSKYKKYHIMQTDYYNGKHCY